MAKVPNIIRRQLTLFVQSLDSEIIEKIRHEFNPQQSALIKCHVTLCREDEIENLELVLENLNLLDQKAIIIEFGSPIRFDNGTGVLLPAKTNNLEFQKLRSNILQGIIDNPRIHEPHVTLMHPRNSICTDDIFDQIKKSNLPTKINFNKISLIEQINGGYWNILQEFELKQH